MGTGIKDKRGAYAYIKKHNLKCECEICHNTEWNKEPIPLQIHHIDGNHYNNDESNIQILCPNCHAQTNTYCSKNRKKVKEIYYCKICGKKLYSNCKTGMCKKCCNELEKLKSKCPSKEQLLQDLQELNSYCAIGRKYNVNDHTVKKWCNKFGITK